MDARINLILESLRAVALPAEDQYEMYPCFVLITDEIITSFSDSFLLVEGLLEDRLLSKDSFDALNELDNWFELNCGDKSILPEESLKTHLFWQKSREIANRAIALISEDNT